MKGIKWSRACMPWLLLMRCVAPVTSWDYCMIYIIPTVTKLEWAERQVRESAWVCVWMRKVFELHTSMYLCALALCSPAPPDQKLKFPALPWLTDATITCEYCTVNVACQGILRDECLLGMLGDFPTKNLLCEIPTDRKYGSINFLKGRDSNI